MKKSQTKQLHNLLLDNGYDSTLKVMFDSSYNRDYNYLGIIIPLSSIKDVQSFYDLTREFRRELISFWNGEVTTLCYSIRKTPRFAELVKGMPDAEFERARKEEILHATQKVYSEKEGIELCA